MVGSLGMLRRGLGRLPFRVYDLDLFISKAHGHLALEKDRCIAKSIFRPSGLYLPL
jgi:hypothetical protein